MINKAEIMRIIQAPHVTEKTTQLEGEKQCYVLRVLPSATKTQIKAAVEIAFNVTVHQVRTCSVKAKKTRFGRVMGKHNGWKKAYVTLAEGSAIELSE